MKIKIGHMKVAHIAFVISIAFISSCSNTATSENEGEKWSEKEEIHFYNDCSDKMIANGMDDEEVHEFCVCCLKQLKTQFDSGKEAMDHLSDEDIARIEKACATN